MELCLLPLIYKENNQSKKATMKDAFSAERLADRAKIQDVLYRLCRAIDRMDVAAIRDSYHPDGMDKHGMYNGNVTGFLQWLEDRHKPITFSMHSISNILIEFSGLDTAIVETYCLGLQRFPADAKASRQMLEGFSLSSGSEVEVMVCCRYVDLFERRDGNWLIKERAVVFDSTRIHELTGNVPKMGVDWIVGKRGGRADYIYAARAEVGLVD